MKSPLLISELINDYDDNDNDNDDVTFEKKYSSYNEIMRRIDIT